MRASGILMPIFSLPGKYGIGCFSKEAYEFVDFLDKAKQKFWQILPIGPTSYGDSPYQSFSTFAGNPYFISLESLIEQGLLTEEECKRAKFGSRQNSIDYERLYNERFELLRKAYDRSGISKKKAFKNFKEENDFWLHDYALFMAVKSSFDGVSFCEWDEDIRLRKDSAMEHYEEELHSEIEFYEYIQYEFYKQWFALKKYANKKGISIIGDIPIYVAYDSADVWAHPELFQLDEDKNPIAVAGCPPDGFAVTGQLWGNPLYTWDYHKETGYSWWISRIEKCKEMYDVVRIDHFRGFDQYYSVPADAENAVNGTWEDGPGFDLFQAIKDELGDTEVIAEDLGFITDSVRKLVTDTGFPNMKILEFGFDAWDSDEPSEYLPFNYDKNCVVYTGTHDNETVMGWLDTMKPEAIEFIQNYIGKKVKKKKDLVYEIIRLAQSSPADFCIIPIQDYLCLGSEARINIPSTLGGNWKWRATSKQLNDDLSEKIKEYTLLYGRANPDKKRRKKTVETK